MDPRLGAIAARAAAFHGVITLDDLQRLSVSSATRSRWVAAGVLVRLAPRAYALGGAPATWQRSLAAALASAGPASVLAGRSGARLHGLDGFGTDAAPELLTPVAHRRRRADLVIVATTRPIDRGDLTVVEGLRCLRPERLILDAPLFGFTRSELERAVDSAQRLRLVSEARLRERALQRHEQAVNGSRALLAVLGLSGVESALERRFLTLVRRARLPEPERQVVHRLGDRALRVDFGFGDLVVEVAGHGTHATRRQRQRDAERQTELTLAGRRVITFTYEDVTERPTWVVERLRQATANTA